MAQERSISTRMTLAIAAATCSATLAAGITAAALFGYVGARRPPVAATDSRTTIETQVAGSGASEPGVVLVPVEPAAAPAIDANAEDAKTLRLASTRHREHERYARDHDRHGEEDDEREDD
jgi:hypothetical protein